MWRRLWLASPLMGAAMMGAGAQEPKEPLESRHVAGLRGMEGWNLKSALPPGPEGTFAFTLVQAGYGRVVQRIKGEPIIWPVDLRG